MKFNKQYYSSYLNLNILRKIGRRFFSPKVPVLFRVIRNLPPQSKVLDAGAGTGGFLQLMEQINPELKTFGLDIGMPPTFMSKGIFLRGDIIHLPFQDNSFDLITCSHVIEHVANPFPIIAELKRICRSGGYIYLETPSHRSALMPVGMNFWDDPTHVRPYTRISLRKLFEMYEMKIIKDGVKHSLAGILFGFPYMFIGRLLGDPLARVIFPMYAFGLSVYVLGRKSARYDS
ncbi:MAG: class I SAM-dependent methyltransferase [Desulfobacteraceae bacterium]|nr:class I SAM-dependent methyltransferase [Desulfobacteraceae bacterium]